MKQDQGKFVMRRLIEDNVERAEVLIAAQDLADKIRDIGEDLSKLVSSKYLIVLDGIKREFGREVAESWKEKFKNFVDGALESIINAYDSISNANLVLQKGIEGGDMNFDEEGDEEIDIPNREEEAELESDREEETELEDLEIENDEENTEKEGQKGRGELMGESLEKTSEGRLVKLLLKFQEILVRLLDNEDLTKHEREELVNLNSAVSNSLNNLHYYSLNEKWGVKYEPNPKYEGKWEDKSIDELCGIARKLRKKKNKTKEDVRTLRQVYFALRAKDGWKRPPSEICGLREYEDDVEMEDEGTIEEDWSTRKRNRPDLRGAYSPYTPKQLKKMYLRLKKKRNKSKEDWSELKRLQFAYQAKTHWGPMFSERLKRERKRKER